METLLIILALLIGAIALHMTFLFESPRLMIGVVETDNEKYTSVKTDTKVHIITNSRIGLRLGEYVLIQREFFGWSIVPPSIAVPRQKVEDALNNERCRLASEYFESTPEGVHKLPGGQEIVVKIKGYTKVVGIKRMIFDKIDMRDEIEFEMKN